MALDSFKAVQAFIDGVAAALTTANNRSQYVLWPPNPLGGDQMDDQLNDTGLSDEEQAEVEAAQARTLTAINRCQDIAAEYDSLADDLARVRDRLNSMTTYSVQSPEDGELDSPRVLRSDMIAHDHLSAIPVLDRLEIQARGRAGAWRILSVKYATDAEL